MGHVWTDDPKPNGEHPIVAVIAVVAIFVAILLIAWARIEVHGTGDLEAAFTEPATGHAAKPSPRADKKTRQEREVDEAVTSSRFATGFSP